MQVFGIYFINFEMTRSNRNFHSDFTEVIKKVVHETLNFDIEIIKVFIQYLRFLIRHCLLVVLTTRPQTKYKAQIGTQKASNLLYIFSRVTKSG